MTGVQTCALPIFTSGASLGLVVRASSQLSLKPVSPNTFQIDDKDLSNLSDRPARVLAAMAEEALKDDKLVTLQNAGGKAFLSTVNEFKNILNQLIFEADDNAQFPEMPLINILGVSNTKYGQQMEFALKSNPEKVFVLTFKRTKDGKQALRVIPQKTVLIYATGTIAAKVADALAPMGIKNVLTNRSPNNRAITAMNNFGSVLPLNAAGAKEYEKAGLPVTYKDGVPITAESYLFGTEGVKKVDLVVEGLDGKAKVVVDAKGMPVMEGGKVLVKLPADATDKGYKLAEVANSLVYKLEVFDRSTVPVLYQGSNKPKLVSNGFVSETGTLETGNTSFDYIKDQKNIFLPSCNTTSLLGVLGPIATNKNVKDKTLDIDIFTIRRHADPGALKSGMTADGFAPIETNYHHKDDVLAMINQQGVDLTRKIKKVIGPEGKEEFVFGTHATMSNQNRYHEGYATIQGMVTDEATGQERPLNANDVKKLLKNSPRVALVQTDPLDKTFNAEIVYNTQHNHLQILHPFMSFAWVKQRPDNKVLIIFLTAQESNVIPNNATTTALKLGLFDPKDVAAANEEINLSMGLDQIKEGFETYLPATGASSTLSLKPVSPNTFQIDDKDLSNLSDRPARVLAAMAEEALKDDKLVTLQNAGGKAFLSTVNEFKNILNQLIFEADDNAQFPEMPLINILGVSNTKYGQQMEFALKSNPEKVFVLTFKRTKDGKQALRVIPQKTVLIYATGTIAAKVADALAPMGIKNVLTNRSPNNRAITAMNNFGSVLPLNAAGAKEYEKAGLPVTYKDGVPITAESYLFGTEGVKKVDLVVEGLDGKAKVVVDAKGMPVMEGGKVLVKLPADATDKGYKLAEVANSLVYKLEVFDRSTVPVLYQGSNKPKLVSNGFVSETGTLETGNTSFDYIKDQKNIFLPSCNTTSLLGVLGPIATNKNVKDKTLDIDIFTIRRHADPGALKSGMTADGFAPIETNYHHKDDVLAMINQQGVDLTRKIKKVIGPEGKEEFVFGTHATMSNQNRYHEGYATIQGMVTDEATGQERPLNANDVKKLLKNSPRVALVQTDPLDKTFNAEIVYNTQHNHLQILHPFMSFAWVKQRPDNKVLIIFLTAQESNVIPNNATTTALKLGLFDPKDVAAANEEINLSMGLDQIKEGFETYLPATMPKVVSSVIINGKAVMTNPVDEVIVKTVGDRDRRYVRAVNATDTSDLLPKFSPGELAAGGDLINALKKGGKAVMAVNVLSYNQIKGHLEAARDLNAAIIFETARSQLGYALNAEKAAEYILKVAKEVGFTGPIVLHGDHIQYSEDLFKQKKILDAAGGDYQKAKEILRQNVEKERQAITNILEDLIKAGYTSVAIDASTMYDEVAGDAVLEHYGKSGTAEEKLIVELENGFLLPLEWGAQILSMDPDQDLDRLNEIKAKIVADMESRQRPESEINDKIAALDSTFGILSKEAKKNGLGAKDVVAAYDKIMRELGEATVAGKISEEVLGSMTEDQKALLLPSSNAQETAYQLEQIELLLKKYKPELVGRFGLEVEVGHVDKKVPNPRMKNKLEAKMTHPAAVRAMGDYLKDKGLAFHLIATNNGSGHGTEFDVETLTPVSQVGKISPWLTQELSDVAKGYDASIAQHGTSGSDDAELSDLQKAGIVKFNIATIYQQIILNVLSLEEEGQKTREDWDRVLSTDTEALTAGLHESVRVKMLKMAKDIAAATDKDLLTVITPTDSLFVQFLKATYQWGVKKGKIDPNNWKSTASILAKEFKRSFGKMDPLLSEIVWDLDPVALVAVKELMQNGVQPGDIFGKFGKDKDKTLPLADWKKTSIPAEIFGSVGNKGFVFELRNDEYVLLDNPANFDDEPADIVEPVSPEMVVSVQAVYENFSEAFSDKKAWSVGRLEFPDGTLKVGDQVGISVTSMNTEREYNFNVSLNKAGFEVKLENSPEYAYDQKLINEAVSSLKGRLLKYLNRHQT